MKIRKTTLEDLDRVMEIYAYARTYMAAHGNPNQWGPTQWPPEPLIRSDIAAGNSYVSNGALSSKKVSPSSGSSSKSVKYTAWIASRGDPVGRAPAVQSDGRGPAVYSIAVPLSR